jgi:hypothetical protein
MEEGLPLTTKMSNEGESSMRIRDEEITKKSDFYQKIIKCMAETDVIYEKFIGG